MHPSAAARRHRDDEDDEEDEEEEEELPPRLTDNEYADGEGDPCPNCGRVYRCSNPLPPLVVPTADRPRLAFGRPGRSWSGWGSDWVSAFGVVSASAEVASASAATCCVCVFSVSVSSSRCASTMNDVFFLGKMVPWQSCPCNIGDMPSLGVFGTVDQALVCKDRC